MNEPRPALRRLFLTLFLRGRSSRGLQKSGAPSSVASRLALTLLFYVVMGGMAVIFANQPVLTLSVWLNGLTFVFLGSFVAASSGEILFNKEEADILLHRPVTPRQLLWAKVGVLLEVSFWIAGAFNLGGFAVGALSNGGNWLFAPAHLLSTTMEAFFCTAAVVVVYQVCLRWFGRERLDGLMTTAQVVVGIGAVLSGQLMPQLIGREGTRLHVNVDAWWLPLLPPAWFAGIDDALAGTHAGRSWMLAGLAAGATALVLLLAFGRLARDYGAGLQKLGEAAAPPAKGGRRRLLHALVHRAPLKWWLRDPVTRASFLLCAAYLARDRDVKLRIYPGLVPILVIPLVMFFRESSRGGDMFSIGFGTALAGAFLSLIPALGINLLQYSAQWQAADAFRSAPLAGPAPLCSGARRAVLLLLAVPSVVALAIVTLLVGHNPVRLLFLIPGALAMPAFALVPCALGHAVPLSLPGDEAKSANRGLYMIVMMFFSMGISLVAIGAWFLGLFWWLIGLEAAAVVALCLALHRTAASARWTSIE